MIESTDSLSIWIPLLAALAGAVLGIAGSFLPIWWKYSKEVSAERRQRDRERLEELYNTSIEIRGHYTETLGSLISRIHYGTEFKLPGYDGVPPLAKYEMLVNLYYPELKDSWAELQQSVYKFGDAMVTAMTTNYESKSKTEKQEVSGQLTALHLKIHKKVEIAQAQVVALIEP